MIRVTQFPEGHKYVRCKITSSSPTMSFRFWPLFGPFTPSGGSVSQPILVTECDGWISHSGPPDVNDDKSVEHRQINGELNFLPFSAAKADLANFRYPVWQCTVGSTLVQYTHVFGPGSYFFDEVPDFVSGRVWYHVARMDASGLWAFGYGSVYIQTGAFTGYLSYYQMLPTGKYKKKLSVRTYSLSFFTDCATQAVAYTTTYADEIFKPNTVSIPAVQIARDLGIFGSWHATEAFHPAHVRQVENVWGDMAQDCIDQLRVVDTNTLSFVSELREVAKLIPKLPIGDEILNPKKWANVYLCLRYGLSLTAADIRALGLGIMKARSSCESLSDHLFREYAMRTASGSLGNMPYTDTYHYKVTHETMDVPGMGAVRLLDSWGFYPTPARMWDMIPLSFVLDWFVKVGDWTAQIDADLLKNFYKVVSVCWSRKVVLTYPISDLFPNSNVSGFCTLVHYRRGISNKLAPIAFRIETAGEFHNWVDGAALIIANVR